MRKPFGENLQSSISQLLASHYAATIVVPAFARVKGYGASEIREIVELIPASVDLGHILEATKNWGLFTGGYAAHPRSTHRLIYGSPYKNYGYPVRRNGARWTVC